MLPATVSPPFELHIEPSPAEVREPPSSAGSDRFADRPLADWRAEARRELGIDDGRPVIATGHQTLLWHPGILAKYLLVESVRGDDGRWAAANLIVDQHTGDFDRYEVPVVRADGRLAVGTIELATRAAPPDPDVPMGALPPFDPNPTPELPLALDSVRDGVTRIAAAVAAHRDEPTAAMQMAGALEELMTPWVRPLPGVTSSALVATAFGQAVLSRMADEPRACVTHYNDAVRSVPEAGVGTLGAGGDEGVELPLWYLDDGRRRRRAHAEHLRASLETGEPALLPRALLLTALVRLIMCDRFVHGTGGAVYDRAMERWVRSWLGIEPAPAAVATATLRLPFDVPAVARGELARIRLAARRAHHDPLGADGSGPSSDKRAVLESIDAAPRGSVERRRLFYQLHDRLEVWRHERRADVGAAQRRVKEAEQALADAPIVTRRTWAFPLYPTGMIDELAAIVGAAT